MMKIGKFLSFGDADVFAQELESYVTWWIPLPEAIDLPDRHQRAITNATPDLAHAEAEDGVDDGSWQIDHQLRFTVHQREYETQLVDPALNVLWSVANDADGQESTQNDGASFTPGTHYLSIIEAEVLLPPERHLDEQELSDFFDYVLDRIRQLQEATALITKNLSKDWIARERLPVLIPMRRIFEGEEATSDDGMGAFLVSPNTLSTMTPPEQLSEDSIEQLQVYLENDDEGVAFTAYHRLRYETMVLYHRRGDYRMTVVSAAIAAESLINEMLQLLFWDEGRYPEEIAPKFNQDEKTSVLRRVISEFSRHLGGEWNPNKKGPIQEWRKKIAEPRNEIAHAGVMPSRQQAEDALSALRGLERYMGKRLLEKIPYRPRTAVLFLGLSRLEKEKALTKRLQRLVYNDREPHWANAFARWRDVLDTEVQKARGVKIRPDIDNTVLQVVIKGSQTQLVLLDEANSLAAPVPRIPAQLRGEFDRITLDVKKTGVDGDAVIPLPLKDSKLRRELGTTKEWDHAYKLVPGFDVMSNGRNTY